jgi:hypothetical protein
MAKCWAFSIAGTPGAARVGAAAGDVASQLVEGRLAVLREPEGDAGLTGTRVDDLLRAGQIPVGQRGLVLEHVPAALVLHHPPPVGALGQATGCLPGQRPLADEVRLPLIDREPARTGQAVERAAVGGRVVCQIDQDMAWDGARSRRG